MKDIDLSEYIKKAKQSLEAAKHLLEAGYPDFSASRSYYAMFYSAEAVLLTKNLSFSKHKSVISAFGKEFIKTETFPSKLHRNISDAFDLRLAADYAHVDSVSKEKAEILIEQTKEFLKTIEAYLEKKDISQK
jgi:uncharacterized protein (UPF0332 family)